ncbi:hypothetical protein F5Y18DRAFT_442472 [Xylariaceae sp. FL1019]|nr:hypothetical protein F5Y18DRAFT_442472 [Xylariaceae sp. FL1019]
MPDSSKSEKHAGNSQDPESRATDETMDGLPWIPDMFRQLFPRNAVLDMDQVQHHPDFQRHVQQHLDNQRNALHSQWESERSKYASNIEELESKIRNMGATAMRERDVGYTYGVQDTKDASSRELASQARASAAEIRDLQQTVNEKNKELDSVKDMWQDAVRDLSSLKTSNKCFAIDDATLVAKWESLQYVIKNFAVSYLSHIKMICPMTSQQEADYTSLTPMYKDLLGSEEYIDVLLQARVWKFLVRRLFGDPDIVWGEDARVKMRSLLGLLSETGKIADKDWHTFRAQSVSLVRTAVGAHKGTREYLDEAMSKVTQPFVAGSNMEELTADWHDIIDKAVELATIFSQSRCHYAFAFSRTGEKYTFNDDQMVDIISKLDDGASVMVLISPLFKRYGNSKGDDYDQGVVLAKASVLCNQSYETKPSKEDEEEL